MVSQQLKDAEEAYKKFENERYGKGKTFSDHYKRDSKRRSKHVYYCKICGERRLLKPSIKKHCMTHKVEGIDPYYDDVELLFIDFPNPDVYAEGSGAREERIKTIEKRNFRYDGGIIDENKASFKKEDIIR